MTVLKSTVDMQMKSEYASVGDYIKIGVMDHPVIVAAGEQAEGLRVGKGVRNVHTVDTS